MLGRYTKCVFLDADTLPLVNVDELFDRPDFSAAPDVGWPDCFNSGVFVYTPSLEIYAALLRCAAATGSFDGGDQGLLNTFYASWATGPSEHRLPFLYNMTANASYGYAPAYAHFHSRVKIVHFIGAHKPWHAARGSGGGGGGSGGDALAALVDRWWQMYDDFRASTGCLCPSAACLGIVPCEPFSHMPPSPPPPPASASASALPPPPDSLSSHGNRRSSSLSGPDRHPSGSAPFSEIESLLNHYMAQPLRLPYVPPVGRLSLVNVEFDVDEEEESEEPAPSLATGAAAVGTAGMPRGTVVALASSASDVSDLSLETESAS